MHARSREHGIASHALPGLTVVDDVPGVTTQSGAPYTRLLAVPPQPGAGSRAATVLRAPRKLPPLPDGVDTGAIPSLDELGLTQEVDDPMRGGETEARRRLDELPARPGRAPTPTTTTPSARDSTSRLSPYLHFGCVSPREVEERLPRGKGRGVPPPARLARLLPPRALSTSRATRTRSSRSATARTIDWDDDDDAFDAWCEGRTGFPLVDAGMRQLRREGWMHNRARLVVASFLTKDLGHRLAPRRALLHAPADRRRRGEQQRQLAVDRVGRRRPAAVLPPHLQPGAAHGALRPARATTCAATCPSCATCPDELPARAVDDAGRGAARVRRA